MPASLDCALCLLRQSLDAARFATDDVDVQTKVLESSMRLLLDRGLDSDPPWIGTLIHGELRATVDDPDPYYKEKKRFNRLALEHWDDFKRWISEAVDPFETTVRLAIAGNSIDFALGAIDEKKINAAIRKAINQPLNGSIQELRAVIENAETILYLTDNAGEIVYDKLLVETLISDEFNKKVTVATRGKPILNDALREDAEEVGMTELVPVIDNGSDGLGVLFSLTSQEFNDVFANADLVIAKGLANYETLGESKGPIFPKKIAYLFKAKCPFMARYSGTTLGDLVVRIK